MISDYSSRRLIEPVEGLLAQAKIDPASFTPPVLQRAARAGVEKHGKLYAMPWDTIGRLFHIDTALMSNAGLMRDGKPVLPRSPEELLVHARQFKAQTGKPYLIQAQVSAPDFMVAFLYTHLLAEHAPIFPDNRHICLDTPEARAIVTLMRQRNAEGLTTKEQNFPAATAAVTQGNGGIFPVGTWMLGPYDAEAAREGSPLKGHYAAAPFPKRWGMAAPFTGGHAWVGSRLPSAARPCGSAGNAGVPRAPPPQGHRRAAAHRQTAPRLCRAAERRPGADRRRTAGGDQGGDQGHQAGRGRARGCRAAGEPALRADAVNGA